MLDDDQVPPVVALVKLVADPAHTSVVPLMAATTGIAFTVTVVAADVAEHPLAATNVKLTPVLAETPVINPVLSIVAAASLLDHTPPEEGVIVVVLFTHTSEGTETVGATSIGSLAKAADEADVQLPILAVTVYDVLAVIPVIAPPAPTEGPDGVNT